MYICIARYIYLRIVALPQGSSRPHCACAELSEEAPASSVPLVINVFAFRLHPNNFEFGQSLNPWCTALQKHGANSAFHALSSLLHTLSDFLRNAYLLHRKVQQYTTYVHASQLH
jgi:hypothetical protein